MSKKGHTRSRPGIPAGSASPEATLRALASARKARVLMRFFKTGPGEYAHGDRFMGVTVPAIRSQLRRYKDLPHAEVLKLLRNPWHEVRMLGLLIWVKRFEKGDSRECRRIFEAYLKHAARINNWDLVDVSAPAIAGGWTLQNPTELARVQKILRSSNLWERRIAVVSTLAWIRAGRYEPTLEFVQELLRDPCDPEPLLHKACGWMLREVGKRNRSALSRFLGQHAAMLPRTMLRYAIEHYPARERRRWMGLKK